MKALAAIGLTSVIALAAASPADARQGCGAGFHRNAYERCVPNRGAWFMSQGVTIQATAGGTTDVGGTTATGGATAGAIADRQPSQI